MFHLALPAKRQGRHVWAPRASVVIDVGHTDRAVPIPGDTKESRRRSASTQRKHRRLRKWVRRTILNWLVQPFSSDSKALLTLPTNGLKNTSDGENSWLSYHRTATQHEQASHIHTGGYSAHSVSQFSAGPTNCM